MKAPVDQTLVRRFRGEKSDSEPAEPSTWLRHLFPGWHDQPGNGRGIPHYAIARAASFETPALEWNAAEALDSNLGLGSAQPYLRSCEHSLRVGW